MEHRVPINRSEIHGSEMPSPSSRQNKMRPLADRQKQVVLGLIILILLIVAAGTSAYYVNKYHQSQKEVKRLSNPQQVAADQNQQLINQVGKLTPLPTGETPTIATVTDITKLKDQAFFVNAVNGDKVLIYTQAKKAYLYRPSTNKIINIAPVNLGTGQSSTGTTTNTSTTKNK